MSDVERYFEVARARVVEEVRERPSSLYRATMPPADEAGRLRAELGHDGTWADLDFAERDPTGVEFPPLRHLGRALLLAVRGFPDEALAALDAWRRSAPRADNWWYNEIAAPQVVADTLIAAHAALDAGAAAAWGRWLADTVGPVPLTGDNLMWSKAVVLRAGLLTGDDVLVRSAVEHISSVLRVGDGDGIQEDFSYHHHGPLLYSGNYGAALAPEVTLWIRALHGTPWALGEQEVSVFVDFLLDGQRWAVHGGGFDFTTMGRAVSRPGGHDSVTRLRTALHRLLRADPPRAAELMAFDASLDGGPGPVGTRCFPRSDYLVHRRPTWSVAVRMSSTRTIPTESMLGENLRGRHLADGVATVRVGHGRNDGYRSVLPVWDWTALPGLTAARPSDPSELVPRPNGVPGASPDVACWADGVHGAAVMRLRGTDGFTEGWKGWFCFPDWFVALGVAITAPGSATPVVTTVDQRHASGDLVVDAGGRHVHHGRIGYVSLDGQRVRAEVDVREGSWADLSHSGPPERLSVPVFTAWFDHGPRAEDASYAYLVLPDVDPGTTAAHAAEPPAEVLENAPGSWAVRCRRTGVVLAVRSGPGGPAFRIYAR
jgi:chondroitin AC lyase